MRLSLLAFCVLSMTSFQVFASQGEVCLSKPVLIPANEAFDNATVFECKTAGKLTVSDMYAKGWRIMTVFPQVITSKTTMRMVWTVVIEKI